MRSVVESLPLPPVYYRPEPSPCYYREDAAGRWMKIDQTSLRTYVNGHGYDGRTVDGTSEINRVVLALQDHQNVAYAAPLAGFKAGVHEINGNRILSPNLRFSSSQCRVSGQRSGRF